MIEVHMYKSKLSTIISTSLVLVGIFVFCIGLFTHKVEASTITSINPVADASIKKDNPDNNYGTDTTFVCQGSDFRAVYFKFDLTSFAGKSILSAKLRLKTTSDGSSRVAHSFKFVSNSNWTENTITYNNSYNSTDATLKPTTLLATINEADSGVWVEVPITSIVSQEKGKLLTIACIPATTSTNAIKFNSKEATSDKPALIIESDPAPTIVPDECAWCGNQCVNGPIPPETMCAAVAPSPGFTCKRVNSTCTAVPVTPSCITRPACLSQDPPCLIKLAPGVVFCPISPTPINGGFNGITLGQSVSGTIYVTFYSDKNLTNFMRFYIDNKFVNEEHEYPYSLGGDTAGVVNGFDTRQLTNSTHTLRAEIHYKDGTTQLYEVTFTVNNQIQITPVCKPRVACPVDSTDALCMPDMQPFGGWCPPVTISMNPTPTCIPRPRCSLPGANPMCSLAAPPEGAAYCPVSDGPIIHITKPTIEESVPVGALTVTYTEAGNLQSVDHVHLILDDLPEVMDRDNNGSYTFANVAEGPHTLVAYLVKADHTPFPNIESRQEISFHVGASTVSITPCYLKNQGDANCDSRVDMIDYEIWRQEFIGQVTSLDADFNSSDHSDLVDYEVWRQGFVARLLP